MTIHIDYDREENKIELILDSQTKMIRTLELLLHLNMMNYVDVVWNTVLTIS